MITALCFFGFLVWLWVTVRIAGLTLEMEVATYAAVNVGWIIGSVLLLLYATGAPLP